MRQADKEGHVALTRHLCEQVLAVKPDHGPTLIRYAACLTNLSLYDDASAALERAERVVPTDMRHFVLAQWGHLRESQGDFDTAEQLFLSAYEHDSDDATYLIYAGSSAFARGDVVRAEKLARQALSCSEGCIDEAYFNLGGYLLAQKQYEEARECYLRAIELDPNYDIAKKRLDDLDRLQQYQREQGKASQSTTHSEAESEGNHEPQPDSEVHSK
ncbi:MAG: tetratricopeptide repeat protein [Verrucomicrobiota bacterium]